MIILTTMQCESAAGGAHPFWKNQGKVRMWRLLDG